MDPRRVFVAAFLCILTIAAAARAQTYVSTGSGGELISSAQVISSTAPESLMDITGSLPLVNGTSGGNIFEIYISNPAQFSASTTSLAGGENQFDTQLFLFNASGLGIEANDDSPNGGQQSLLPAGSSYLSNQSAGDYYLLIEGSGRYPTDSSGGLIFPNFTDGVTQANAVVGPTGAGGAFPFDGFTGSSGDGGDYSIALTGAEYIAPIPEPSALQLLALGSVLFLFSLRFRCSNP